MEPAGVLGLLCLAGGLVLAIVGFVLAPNLGLSPVLAYSAGLAPEAGVVQPSTRRRVLGARLKLLGFLLTLAALLLIGIAMADAQAGGGPPAPGSP